MERVKNFFDAVFIYKYTQKVLALAVLGFLYLALILSIVYQVDGLGVFAIAGCFLAFCFILFNQPKPNEVAGASGSSGDENIKKNVDSLIDAINKPHIKKYLFELVIPILCKNLHLLDSEQLEQLKLAVPQLEKKIQAKKGALKHKPKL